MLADKPTELSRNKHKLELDSPSLYMISEHSAHLAPLSVDFRTWLWRYTYLLLLISMLWHRQAIFKSKGDKLFLCWMQDLNPRPQIPNRQQTECSLTNRLSYRGSSINLNSTARPYDQQAFSPLGPTFIFAFTWWRHQMETFSALLAICAGNSPVTGELPSQRPVTRSFEVFFDLCLNKRLSQKSWGWWFETP